MSEPQKPSLGRVVHFRGGDRSFVATVTGTVNEGCELSSPMHANLSIEWDRDDDVNNWRPDIPYSDTPKGGHWHWPPRV